MPVFSFCLLLLLTNFLGVKNILAILLYICISYSFKEIYGFGHSYQLITTINRPFCLVFSFSRNGTNGHKTIQQHGWSCNKAMRKKAQTKALCLLAIKRYMILRCCFFVSQCLFEFYIFSLFKDIINSFFK